MIISILAFSIVANYGMDFIVETVLASLEKTDDEQNDTDNNDPNDVISEDLSVAGTYSFAVFITQNTYVPDYAPAFDGYTYDSIMQTYEMQYSQILRYVSVVTIDAVNHQILVDTMSANFLVSYNDVYFPLDYIYYLIRTGSSDFDYRYLTDIAGAYTGLSIDNYFIANLDRFCDIANYVENAVINVPEKFTGYHPLTNEQISVSSGEQPLTYDLLHMVLNNNSYLTYEGVCRSASEVFTTYLKTVLYKGNQKNIDTLIRRWKQKSTTDLTVESISDKLDIIFSTHDYEAYSVVPSATLKKHGEKFYYIINVNESITNIKKYYNKASS